MTPRERALAAALASAVGFIQAEQGHWETIGYGRSVVGDRVLAEARAALYPQEQPAASGSAA